MKLQRYNPVSHNPLQWDPEMDECADGEYYRVSDVDALLIRIQALAELAQADVDALLGKLSVLTCKAEVWEADEDIIVVHGVGIVGSTLSRRNSGAVERWFNGAMGEIVERLTKGGE